jgi:PAS domain S-box-containing protein
MSGRYRALLIEDDRDDFIIIKNLLPKNGFPLFDLDWVNSYEAGLEAICRAEYDVILLDYRLGERNGLELLGEAVVKGCAAPVIFLTGQGDYEIDIQAMRTGAADYLIKAQLTRDLLERSIRYSIERKRAEVELKRYRDHLEELIEERTAQLEERTEQLEKKNHALRLEVAEREKAEEALGESERNYRDLVDNSLDIIYTINSDGTICSLNPAFERITGWSSSEWIGKDFSPLIHPEDLQLARERFQSTLEGKIQFGNEVRVFTKNGDCRILELKTVPRVQKGKIVGVFGNARDVTDRKSAEEKLKEQKDFLSTVLNSLSYPFYVVSADDYTIKMANSTAVSNGLPPDIACYAPEYSEGASCGDHDHFLPLERIKRTGQALTTEHVHYDKAGTPRNIEVHGYPIFDKEGQVIQIIEYFLDITERKKIEHELRSTRDELAKERSLLRSILTQLPAGVVVAEQTGRIILMNDHAASILGHPDKLASHIDEYAEYRTFYRDGRPYDPDRYPLRRSLENGEFVMDEEATVISPHGEEKKVILANSSPIRDLEGNIVAAVVIFQDITDRKKADEDLHRREQEYRALVENSPDVVMRVDRELRRIFANPALSKATGYPMSSFLGTTIYEPPREDRLEYVSRMETACKKVLSTGQEEAIDFPYLTTSGLRHFHMRIVPEYSKDGQIKTLLTISRDVTDLRQMQDDLLKAKGELEIRVRERTAELLQANQNLQAEISERKNILEKLRKSEERYRELVENANSIIMRMDSEGRVTFFNEFAQDFFGFTEDEILGQNTIGTIVPETESTGRDLVAMIRGIVQNPAGYVRNENENMRKNGERVWVYWTNKALTDSSGRIIGVLCIGSDITERKNAEEALKLDELRLHALWELSQMNEASLEQIADFVLEQQVRVTKSKIGWLGFMNEDQTVLTLHISSKAALEKCSVTPDKAIHFPVESAGMWANAVRERKTIIVNDYSAPHRQKSGLPEGHAPLARFMVTPILDGNRIVGVAAVGNKDDDYDARDIRQHTLLLDGMWKLIQREKAGRALREAENLAAIGRALSSVAHDMKIPLVAIGGFSRLVQGHLSEDSPDREKLEIILNETERLEKMVRDMLDFSRPLALEKRRINLDAAVKESLQIVESIAREKGVSFSYEDLKDFQEIVLDPARFKQALINVLMNAVQASPEGERVVVRTRKKGAFVLIDVSDRGPGIPPEKRKEIFYPFMTTKKGGTGLGLPIIKKIVEAHEGKVEILEDTGVGTTFRLSFPAAA